MSLLSELKTIIEAQSIPVETGVFSEEAPDRYAVITPVVETFELYSDNKPHHEIQEVRISLFDRGNYTSIKSQVVSVLLAEGITITDRRYIGYEGDTGYHHFAIDVAKDYSYEMEE